MIIWRFRIAQHDYQFRYLSQIVAVFVVFGCVPYLWHYQEVTRPSMIALWPIRSARIMMIEFMFPWVVI